MASRSPLSSQRTLWLSLAVVFGLFVAACGGGAETTADAPTTGDAIAAAEEQPDATAADLFSGDFVDLNGEAIDFASLEGQDVVLWFWAPW